MKKNHFSKKLTGIITLSALVIGFVMPLGMAIAQEDELYKLYLDQAKEYESNDYGLILENSAKILEMTGMHSSCPNFTRYIGKSFDSVESFTTKFREMMGLVTDECIVYINKNMSLVGTEFYGHGQIFDWFNAAYVAIKNNPEVEFVDFDAPTEEPIAPEQDVKKEPVVEEPVIVVPVEETKTEEPVKPVEEIKTISEPVGTEATKVSDTQAGDTEKNAGDTSVNATDTSVETSEVAPLSDDAVSVETGGEVPSQVEFIHTEEDNNANGLPDFFEEIFEIPASTNDAGNDSDNDGLSNSDEYDNGTDPIRADSDGDGISDVEEISRGTNPVNEDTDGDLITDNEEINAGTDPLRADSDNNGISDFVERRVSIEAGTVIIDQNSNSVPDVVEEQIAVETGITIENGYQDSDGDGLSDAFEALKGTDITDQNSIDREFSDNEVILDYVNIRSQRTDRSALIKSTTKARIVNIKSGEVLVDPKPVFKGTAPDGAIVVFYYQDPETGVTLELGKVTSGGGDKFIFRPEYDLPLGTHTISVRVYNKEGISIDYVKPIEIIVAAAISEIDTAKTAAPTVESINEVTIEESKEAVKENVLEQKNPSSEERKAQVAKLKLEYEKGRKNTIRGYSAPGSIVEVYWQSLIISSAVIADAETGYYEVSPGGELEPGDHTAWLYSVDPETNAKSKSSKVEFSIEESAKAAVLTLENGNGLFLILMGALALLAVAGALVLKKKKSLTHLS